MVSNSEEGSKSTPKTVSMRLFAVAVVIIILLSSILAFVAFDVYPLAPRHYDYDDYYFVHSYSVKIFPSASANFSIHIPIPVVAQSNSTYGLFPSALHADNPRALLEIVTTEHGVSLLVTGDSPVNISWLEHWYTNSGKPFYADLSMIEPNNVSGIASAVAFFKTNGAPVGFSIDYYSRYQYGYGGRSTQFHVNAVAAEDGWHQTVVSIDDILIN